MVQIRMMVVHRTTLRIYIMLVYPWPFISHHGNKNAVESTMATKYIQKNKRSITAANILHSRSKLLSSSSCVNFSFCRFDIAESVADMANIFSCTSSQKEEHPWLAFPLLHFARCDVITQPLTGYPLAFMRVSESKKSFTFWCLVFLRKSVLLTHRSVPRPLIIICNCKKGQYLNGLSERNGRQNLSTKSCVTITTYSENITCIVKYPNHTGTNYCVLMKRKTIHLRGGI